MNKDMISEMYIEVQKLQCPRGHNTHKASVQSYQSAFKPINCCCPGLEIIAKSKISEIIEKYGGKIMVIRQ